MDRAVVNGVALEYEISGSGEPVLLIGTGPLADSFLPFQSEPALAAEYQLIRYRQRQQVRGAAMTGPVSFADHASDAVSLLRHLGVESAHAVGHSTGAAIALELVGSHPAAVRSLVLLEPPLASVPSAADFFERAGPSLAAYAAGDHAEAMLGFLAVVSGLDRDTCRAVVEARIPGGSDQAVAGAGVFFGSYLPALEAWRFGAGEAAAISQPVLSVVGTATDPFFADSHELLRSWIPQLEECRIEGAGHLLHLQDPAPVAEGIAAFLARHATAAGVQPLS